MKKTIIALSIVIAGLGCNKKDDPTPKINTGPNTILGINTSTGNNMDTSYTHIFPGNLYTGKSFFHINSILINYNDTILVKETKESINLKCHLMGKDTTYFIKKSDLKNLGQNATPIDDIYYLKDFLVASNADIVTIYFKLSEKTKLYYIDPSVSDPYQNKAYSVNYSSILTLN